MHSASTFEPDGTRKPETVDDLAVTARFARYLKDWGTPPVIIGKMMGTPGKETATLTDSDLQAWNVRILTAGSLRRRPTPRRPTPPPPADTRSKGQRIYDFALRSEGTPMSKFSEIIEYNWTGKVEFFKSMGAQFTKECGGGTCKYRGELWSPNQQVRYYVESVNGERVFCVKNYRTGLGACANQDTDEVVYLRKVGANDRWLKASSLLQPRCSPSHDTGRPSRLTPGQEGDDGRKVPRAPASCTTCEASRCGSRKAGSVTICMISATAERRINGFARKRVKPVLPSTHATTACLVIPSAMKAASTAASSSSLILAHHRRPVRQAMPLSGLAHARPIASRPDARSRRPRRPQLVQRTAGGNLVLK